MGVLEVEVEFKEEEEDEQVISGCWRSRWSSRRRRRMNRWFWCVLEVEVEFKEEGTGDLVGVGGRGGVQGGRGGSDLGEQVEFGFVLEVEVEFKEEEEEMNV